MITDLDFAEKVERMMKTDASDKGLRILIENMSIDYMKSLNDIIIICPSELTFGLFNFRKFRKQLRIKKVKHFNYTKIIKEYEFRFK